MKHITTTNNENICFITLDTNDKEMNILSKEMLEEFNQTLDKISEDKEIKALIIKSAKPNNFIAGANIEEIAAFKTIEDATAGASAMQEIFQKLHTLKIPTVAAINGACLGGGLEMSLACDWRIATNESKTKLALPEIQLGLIPGAGGTQRLPRLVGIEEALGLILTGKKLVGKKALKIGLVDACVPKYLLEKEAISFALKGKRKKKVSHKFTTNISKEIPKWAIEGNPLGRKVMHKKAKDQIDKKTNGFYPASYKALDAVFDGMEMSLISGLKLEASLFGELVITKESKSLIHLFHATTNIKKHPYKDALKERFADNKTSTIGVIGAGLMGAGIATVASDRNVRVKLSDPSKDSIGRALKYASDFFSNKIRRRRMKSFEKAQKLAHISPSLNPSDFNHCDVVIEAVFEDLDLKCKILKELEGQKIHPDWIFASNTSAIPISKISETAQNPERVCGMHFFSPVEKMPLLEVVVTDQTADWVAARVIQLGQDMGKQVIVVKDGPGFYTTRALAFFLAEAAKMLSEGNKIDAIDNALTDFGFPVGPITLIDEVGIDVGIHVLETIGKAFPERLITSPEMDAIVESGRLGRKNNKGFYIYENGKKTSPDSEIYKYFKNDKRFEKLPADEIVDRCILAFINESVRCLEEGILSSAYDGDVGAVFGLGFPPFLGGPFKYVDIVGVHTIVAGLKKLEEKYGPRFTPTKMLVNMEESKSKFFPEE